VLEPLYGGNALLNTLFTGILGIEAWTFATILNEIQRRRGSITDYARVAHDKVIRLHQLEREGRRLGGVKVSSNALCLASVH
jgi:hypothetical protein